MFTLTIPLPELVRAKIGPWDVKLLHDCDSADATVADRVLGLETLARRVEEAHVRA